MQILLINNHTITQAVCAVQWNMETAAKQLLATEPWTVNSDHGILNLLLDQHSSL